MFVLLLSGCASLDSRCMSVLPEGNWISLGPQPRGSEWSQFKRPLENDQRALYYADSDKRIAQCVSCGSGGRNRVWEVTVMDTIDLTQEVVVTTCGPY